jgi:hypothetical protein
MNSDQKREVITKLVQEKLKEVLNDSTGKLRKCKQVGAINSFKLNKIRKGTTGAGNRKDEEEDDNYIF